MAWGKKEEAPEENAFASQGQASFPPIYEDSKVLGDFSDEQRWPTRKLEGRLNRYLEFLNHDDPMPRAREGARRIVEHIMFELLYREGVYNVNEGEEYGSEDTVLGH